MASKDYIRALPEFEQGQISVVRAQMSCHEKTARLTLAAKAILDEYEGQMTVRQLYYQLVARGVLHNVPKAYTNIGTALGKARECGVIPYEAFEDRARRIDGSFENLSYLGDDPARYAVDQVLESLQPSWCRTQRWAEQPVYLEVWTEKDALASVIGGVCEELGVPLVICRGYPSMTLVHEAKRRLRIEGHSHKRCVVLYAGDLDPSGWDISRHIQEHVVDGTGSVDFRRVALNPEQVADLDLPPTEQKQTDTRYAGFQKAVPELGDDCYELDAVEPRTLKAMLREAIEMHFDQAIYDDVQARHEQWTDIYESKLGEIREIVEGMVK